MSFLNKLPDEGITFGTPRKTVTRYVVVVTHSSVISEVYGTFGNVKDAIEWAERQAKHTRWSVQPILDIEEE